MARAVDVVVTYNGKPLTGFSSAAFGSAGRAAPLPDGLLGDGDPLHGVDGWKLAWFAWNESTGEGVFEYEHPVHGSQRVGRLQPAGPQHEGWN